MINAQTRVIDVWILNTNTSGEKPRSDYQVNVDEIKQLTKYDLLANVKNAVESVIERQADKMTVNGMYLYSDW